LSNSISYENLNNNKLFATIHFEWSGIKTQINNKYYYFLCIYKSPNVKLNDFLEALYDLLSKFSKLDKSKNIYILVDFNINLVVDNYAPRTFLNLMSGFDLHPIINRPTRISSSCSSIIDNIFTNDNKYSFKGILCEDISDHLPIFFFIKLNSRFVVNKCPPIRTRVMNVENLRLANQLLADIKWPECSKVTDLETDYDDFIQTYLNCINSACPIIIKKNRFRKPWMDVELYNCCLQKNSFYKMYLSSPSPGNKRAYIKSKNFFTKIKKN